MDRRVDGRVCSNCGAIVKDGSRFCKNCGKNLYPNRIDRINSRLNLFGVFIGLAVAVIVLFIGSVLYGDLLSKGIINLTFYYGIVLGTMLFIGGLVTGVLCCDDYSEALVNGGILTLVALIILGLILGSASLIAIGIASTITSAFGSSGIATTTNATSNVTSTATSSVNYAYFVEIISMLILIFLAGIAGCTVGVYLKKLLT